MVERVILVGQEDVVALEVAVDDPRGVRGLKCRRDLLGDAYRASHRQATDAIDLVGEQRTLEVLEDDVRHVVGREAHVRRFDDVRMTEGACGTRLVHEPLDDVGVGGQLRVEDLDGDLALDQRVLRQEHGAHPAFTERFDDAVPTLDHITRLHDRVPRRGFAHRRNHDAFLRGLIKWAFYDSNCRFATTM